MLAKIQSVRILHLAARKRFQRLASSIQLLHRGQQLDAGTRATQKIWRYNDEKTKLADLDKTYSIFQDSLDLKFRCI